MHDSLDFGNLNVSLARQLTELESHMGELVKDLNELTKAAGAIVNPSPELKAILDKIDMKRGVLFE